MAERDTYHHGDLRNALLAATLELVRERGARGFSVSEAARRAGVSISAPYRHFADRDAMLAAVAEHAFAALEEGFESLETEPTLASCAAQIAVAYVDFASEDPARFEVMFAAGLDKNTHPELLEQTWRLQRRLETALATYFAPAELRMRAAELWAIAHGVATLSVGGSLGHVIEQADASQVASAAARTWATGAIIAPANHPEVSERQRRPDPPFPEVIPPTTRRTRPR